MLGRKLAESYAADQEATLSRLSLVDAFIEPAPPAGAGFAVDCSVADITDPAVTQRLVAERPDGAYACRVLAVNRWPTGTTPPS